MVALAWPAAKLSLPCGSALPAKSAASAAAVPLPATAQMTDEAADRSPLRVTVNWWLVVPPPLPSARLTVDGPMLTIPPPGSPPVPPPVLAPVRRTLAWVSALCCTPVSFTALVGLKVTTVSAPFWVVAARKDWKLVKEAIARRSRTSPPAPAE